MSAAAKPEQKLSPLAEQRAIKIAEKREKRAFIAALNGASWGTGLTPMQLEAFAEFLRRFKLDISEIDNLGGRPYRNGRYYMRKIAELAREGRVEWYKGEHIGPDKRLVAAAEAGEQWAIDENTRRFRECIRLGVPAEATFVYRLEVKMRELALPTEAVKFYVPGKQRLGWSKTQKGVKEMVAADPVGDENPETSVETRAWRRVGRLCAAEIPELYQEEQSIELAAASIEAASLAEAEAADAAPAHVTKPVSTQGRDAYDESATAQPALTEGAARTVVIPPKEAATVRRTVDYTVEDDDGAPTDA